MFYGDWLQRRGLLSPTKVALIDAVNQNKPITYHRWNQRVNQLANFMYHGLGIRKGDRISVYAMNRVEYLDLLFGCNKLGAILHVVNWRLHKNELEMIICDAAPRIVFYSQEFSESIRDLRLHLPLIECWIALDQTIQDGDLLWPDEKDNYPNTQPPQVELDWDDPWVICYTGGSTGSPKGAILHYRSMTANSVNTIVSWGLRPDDTIPQYMPFFHTGGLNVLTIPLVHLGATNIVCSVFDVDQIFDQIEQFGVTFFFAVPTMFLSMIQHPRWERIDLSGVRLVMAGGGSCPTVIYEAFWDKGVEFKSGYGLTEAGPNTFWLPTEYMKTKAGSVGRPLFHVDVKLVNESDEELGADQIGHLLIRGPHLFGGYWNQLEATMETLKNGWLRTGDLARRDSDGDYYIVGRIKDMIKSGGENIYPAEVEDLMHRHPLVAEAALIPVSHPKWGEVGRAIVACKSGSTLSEEELRQWLRERIAHYKVPKSIVFLNELPKTGANKVDKTLLLELYGS